MKKLIVILLIAITSTANAETKKEIKFKAFNKDKIIWIIPKETPNWCIQKAKEATKKAIEKLQKEKKGTMHGTFKCKDYY